MFRNFIIGASKDKNLASMVDEKSPVTSYVNEIHTDLKNCWYDDDIVEWLIYLGELLNLSRNIIEKALSVDDINIIRSQYPSIIILMETALCLKYKNVKKDKESRFDL